MFIRVLSHFSLHTKHYYQPPNDFHGTQSILRSCHFFQLTTKFPTFYGSRRFNYVLTWARQLSICWARSIQYTPSHPTLLKIYFNIVIPLTLTSSNWSLSIRFRQQNHVPRRPHTLLVLVKSANHEDPHWAKMFPKVIFLAILNTVFLTAGVPTPRQSTNRSWNCSPCNRVVVL